MKTQLLSIALALCAIPLGLHAEEVELDWSPTNPAPGNVDAATKLALPKTVGSFTLSYTVKVDNGNPAAAPNPYQFPDAGTTPQKVVITVTATHSDPNNEVTYTQGQTFEYWVRGEVDFDWLPEGLSAGQYLDGGETLTLTTPVNGLAMTYAVSIDGGEAEAVTDEYVIPEATNAAVTVKLIATATSNDDQIYVYHGDGTRGSSFSREFTRTVRRPVSLANWKPQGPDPGYVDGGESITLPTQPPYNGVTLSFKHNGVVVGGGNSYTLPTATSHVQEDELVVTASATDASINIVGENPRTLVYKIKRQAELAWQPPLAAGRVNGGETMTLPSEDNGLKLSWTLNEEAIAAGEFQFAEAVETGTQPAVLVATASPTESVILQGNGSKTYAYTIRKAVPFTSPLPTSGKATASTAEVKSELALPARTDNGLNVEYYVNGRLWSEKYEFPEALETAQRIVVRAQASTTEDDIVVQDARAEHEYLLPGEVVFAWKPTPEPGPDFEGGELISLPEKYKGLTLSYTLNNEEVSGSFRLPAATGEEQQVTLTAMATTPSDGSLTIKGTAGQTFPYTISGVAQLEWAPPTTRVQVGQSVELPAEVDGVEMVYQVRGHDVEGSYTFTAADAAAGVTLVARGLGSEEDNVRDKVLTFAFEVGTALPAIREQGTGHKEHSASYDLLGRRVGEGHRGIVIRNKSLIISR